MRLGGLVLLGLVWLSTGEAWAIAAVGKSGAIAPAKPADKPPPAKKSAKKAKAASHTLAVGDLCTLKKPLKTTQFGKPQTLRGGITLKVASFEKDSAVLTAGDGEYKAKRKLVVAACSITSSDKGPGKNDPPLLLESSPPLAATEVAPPTPPLGAAPAPIATAPAPIAATPPPVEAPAPAPLVDSSRHDAPNPHAGMRAAAWALTVVGIVGVGGGAAFFALGDIQAGDLAKRAKAYNAGPTFPQAEYTSINQGRSQVQLYDILMYVSGGVGVAALATGIGLFVASSDTTAKTDVRVQLLPNLGGMSLVGNF